MCIYREAFVFKSISNQLNILLGCNLSSTKSLNTCDFEVDKQILRRLNTIKDCATSFPSLNLHAVNLLLWKKILSHSLQNYYSNQIKHAPQGVLYGGFAARGRTGEGSPPYKRHRVSIVWRFRHFLYNIKPFYCYSYLSKTSVMVLIRSQYENIN